MEEFAQIVRAEKHGTAAIIVGRRSRGTSHVEIVWEGPADQANVAELDAVAALVHSAAALPAPLVLSVRWVLQRQLLEVGFNDVHVQLGVRVGHRNLDEVTTARKHWLGLLTVATDASVDVEHRQPSAVACVAEDGRQARRHVRSFNTIVCELEAIQLALETFPGPLQILSDCQPAVRLIRRRQQTHARHILDRLERIHQLSCGRIVQVSWIRGHCGHRLNEAANRLAIATRRRSPKTDGAAAA